MLTYYVDKGYEKARENSRDPLKEGFEEYKRSCIIESAMLKKGKALARANPEPTKRDVLRHLAELKKKNAPKPASEQECEEQVVSNPDFVCQLRKLFHEADGNKQRDEELVIAKALFEMVAALLLLAFITFYFKGGKAKKMEFDLEAQEMREA